MTCENCSTEHDGSYGSGRFCGSKCARGFSTKNQREEINRKTSATLQGRLTGQALIAKGKQIVTRQSWSCPGCGKVLQLTEREAAIRKYCNPACFYEHHPLGGLRKHSGRSRGGHIDGLFLNSTWELAFYLWCLDQGKKFERNTRGFPYTDFEGKQRNYYPDFVVDGCLVEVKGWPSSLTELKTAAVKEPLTVLYEKDLQEVFSFARARYGGPIELLWNKMAPSSTG